MTKIFELNQDQWVMIYNRGKQLILQYKEEERYTRPVLLANDYGGGFDGSVFEGVLYYLYANDKGEILLRNTRDNLVYYQIRDEGGVALGLSARQGQLVFWYVGQKEQGERFLQCIFPFYPQNSRRVLDGIGADGKVHFMAMGENALVVIEESGVMRIYLVDAELKAREIGDQPDHRVEMERLQGQLDEKEAQTKQLESMIDSARSQYEELMHVAEHYRDEAIRWRSKFTF